MKKNIKKILFSAIAILAISAGSFYLCLSRHYVVPILMYHSVNDTIAYGITLPNANTVTVENFEKQMMYLKNHGYKVITLDELAEGIKRHKAFDHKSVVVTFDDGYEDNYTHAFPILKKYNIPATIFMISDSIDRPGYLTLAEMKEMDVSVIDFGSHTHRHVYLPQAGTESQRDEIINSKKILEEKLGHRIDYLAYPFGGFNKEVKALVKETGYKGACTTNRGRHKFNDDVYELKRIKFVNKSSRWPTIWAQLSGYYNVFRSLRAPDSRDPRKTRGCSSQARNKRE